MNALWRSGLRRVVFGAIAVAWGLGSIPLGLQQLAAQEGKSSSATRTAAERAKANTKAPAFSADRFVRVFRTHREDRRILALADAERFHIQNSELPGALWQVIQHDLHMKGPASDSLFVAIRLHGRLESPDVGEQEIALLAASDPRVVSLAADNLARKAPPGALQPLLRLTAQPEYGSSYGFRRAVVTAIAQIEDPASIDFLTATIAKIDGQLKYEVFRQLVRLTGQNFGGNAAAWQSWWQDNRAGFVFPQASVKNDLTSRSRADRPAPTTAQQPAVWDFALPTFFGTPIFAKRVVFVIDQSRSMLSSVDDVTRMDEAQREFENAVKLLPADAAFDVLAYESVVTPWQGRLVPATPENKADAVRFVTALTPNNKTACYDALVQALDRNENVEAVLFVSDGDPTAGTIVDRAAIVQAITRLNMFHRTSINTIGIDAENQAELFLRLLADVNFGEYHSLR